jgi:transposase
MIFWSDMQTLIKAINKLANHDIDEAQELFRMLIKDKIDVSAAYAYSQKEHRTCQK